MRFSLSIRQVRTLRDLSRSSEQKETGFALILVSLRRKGEQVPEITGADAVALSAICFGMVCVLSYSLTMRILDRPRSILPKPHRECRHCRVERIVYNKNTEKQRVGPALLAQPEPEGCEILEPHIHVCCEWCGAEYPVQR